MKKKNLTQINEMNNLLVDHLLKLMHEGQKKREVLIKIDYAIVAQKIGEKFDLNCNFKHIKIEYKLFKNTFMLLKKFYRVVVNLVSMNQLK